MNPKIYTFYYNRYSEATTSLALFYSSVEHIVVFHSDAQRQKFNSEIIKGEAFVTEHHKGLSGQRNKVLDSVPKGEWVIFCSDDYIQTTAVSDLYASKTKSEEVPDFDKMIAKNVISAKKLYEKTLELIADAEKIGANIAGFASNGNPFYLKNKNKKKGLVEGRWFAMRNTDIRFDENVQTIDDHDITAAHLSDCQPIWVNNWVVPEFARYTSGGYGTLGQRMAQKIKDCYYLVEKYPNVLYFAPKKGLPKDAHIRFR